MTKNKQKDEEALAEFKAKDVRLKKHSLSKRRPAFTLIELMVVIAIIAIVSSIGVASFSKLTGDRLTTDARKIVNDLCWARQRAVAIHRQHRVTFNLTTESYQIFDDLNGDSVFDPATEEIKRQNLSVGVDLFSLVPPTTNLTFTFPQGSLLEAGPDWTITLNSQGKTREVRVFRNTGYVRIQ